MAPQSLSVAAWSPCCSELFRPSTQIPDTQGLRWEGWQGFLRGSTEPGPEAGLSWREDGGFLTVPGGCR